jgi:hypothetical protein
MKIRLHVDSYRDLGNGTFEVRVTYTRPLNPGEPDRDQTRTDCRNKPNDAPTSDDVLALYRALFPRDDVDVAAAA